MAASPRTTAGRSGGTPSRLVALALAPASSSTVTRAACPRLRRPVQRGRAIGGGPVDVARVRRDPRPRGRDVSRAHQIDEPGGVGRRNGARGDGGYRQRQRHGQARRAPPGSTNRDGCVSRHQNRSIVPVLSPKRSASAPNSRATVSHRLPTGVRGGRRRCRCPAPTCPPATSSGSGSLAC